MTYFLNCAKSVLLIINIHYSLKLSNTGNILIRVKAGLQQLAHGTTLHCKQGSVIHKEVPLAIGKIFKVPIKENWSQAFIGKGLSSCHVKIIEMLFSN